MSNDSGNERRAFTLIELLVVIAIIAILAAILFPVFSQAKEAAKKTAAMAQMKQLSLSVMMYAESYDDCFVPASMRTTDPSVDPTVWPPLLKPYVQNENIFIAPGSSGTYAANWGTRKGQTVGYSDATGYDPNSTAVPGAAPPGTEGFRTVVSFSQAADPSSIGLFATTPGGTNKERGYVFNPYNGPDSPDGVYEKGLPLVADVNLCEEVYKGADYTGLAPGQLKPIFARYYVTKRGDGVSPVIFADGHCKAMSANAMSSFGRVIWRFR
ncbi:MAG: prepilin-type N-terminal cleavage/methylation domain-containing protein [Fimbriimonadales bacterium]